MQLIKWIQKKGAKHDTPRQAYYHSSLMQVSSANIRHMNIKYIC